MSESATTVAVGIDVGGTTIKGGVVSADGKILTQDATATDRTSGVEAIVRRIACLIEKLERWASTQSLAAAGIGVGVPGIVNHRDGVLTTSPNLEGWHNVPIVSLLNRATGRPIVLENDANCAALGEHIRGAGRGVRSMALLTLGTGIGSGLILDGKLWRGAMDHAGELGHTVVQIGGRRCTCGQSGCLETYASAFATARRATELIAQGEASCMKEVVDRGESITAEIVVQAASDGDALAKRVWEATCRYLAVACLNLQHTLAPDRIVLSGGMSGAGERLLEPLGRAMDDLNSRQYGLPPQICIAELGNDAGFIGAALGVMQNP